jgi:predicted permease
MDTLWRNVRYAVRSLARTPGSTLTVIVTLAVAIGANSAVFSAIDGVLLKPLPYPDADRLVRASHIAPSTSLLVAIPPRRLLDWTERSSAFEAIAAYYTEDVTDTTGEQPENVRRATVTPGFVDVWRIALALGRDFTAEEHRLGGHQVAIVSDRYWRERRNADPGILGTAMQVDGSTATVVGVLPPAFAAVDRTVDVWMPSPVDAPWTQARVNGWFNGVVGRLLPGVTSEQALADLEDVQAQLAAEYPDSDRDLAVRIVPFKGTVVANVSGSLWLLFGAVTLLLLIACTNIAAMLLARATERERDIAIRHSLGASHAAVMLPLVAETAVLVVAGTVTGLLVAAGAGAAMTTWGADLPRFNEIALDGRILLYTVASMIVVTFLCGVFPAVKSARHTASTVPGGRGQVSSRHWLNWSLVGVQVALSVALLAGAGLLLRSFDALSRVDPGYAAEHLLTFRITSSYAEGFNNWNPRIRRTLEELDAIPGVDAAATSLGRPGVDGRFEQQLELEGDVGRDEPIIAEVRTVSPSYFATLGIPLLAGDVCRQTESIGTEAMVNRSFAAHFFPQRSPIGLHFPGQAVDATTRLSPWRITGIVGDIRDVVHEHPRPTVYFCQSGGSPFPFFLVRTSGDPASLVATIRARLGELEPLRSVYEIAPLDGLIGDVYAQNRARTFLLTLFSVTALALACLGIYGTLSYIVNLRRREVGLRVALGARQGNIVKQFLSKALRIVAVACVVGLALSFAFSRAMSGMLYGVSPQDPVTLAAVILVVVGAAALAALLPAARAARTDPMQALRED